MDACEFNVYVDRNDYIIPISRWSKYEGIMIKMRLLPSSYSSCDVEDDLNIIQGACNCKKMFSRVI